MINLLQTIANIDNLIYVWVMSLWNPLVFKLALVITNIGGTISIGLLFLVSILVLIFKKKYRHAILLTIGLGGAVILEIILKHLIARPRPLLGLIEETGFSFPSAHAMIAVTFFGLLIYIFKDSFKNKLGKGIFIGGLSLLIILIGLSRVYLGVHWFSDVVAGFALGTLWATFSLLLTNRAFASRKEPQKFVDM